MERTVLSVLAILLIAAISGCTTTYYGPRGNRDTQVGYTSHQTGPLSFEVTFRDFPQKTPGRATDLALLRAAELCQAVGAQWFTTSDLSTEASLSRRLIRGRTRVSTYVHRDRKGRYSGSTGYVDRRPDRVKTTAWPMTRLSVSCLKSKPRGDDAFQSRHVVFAHKRRYGID